MVKEKCMQMGNTYFCFKLQAGMTGEMDGTGQTLHAICPFRRHLCVTRPDVWVRTVSLMLQAVSVGIEHVHEYLWKE